MYVHKEHTRDGFWCCNKPHNFFLLYSIVIYNSIALQFVATITTALRPDAMHASRNSRAIPQRVRDMRTYVRLRHYHGQEKRMEDHHMNEATSGLT